MGASPSPFRRLVQLPEPPFPISGTAPPLSPVRINIVFNRALVPGSGGSLAFPLYVGRKATNNFVTYSGLVFPGGTWTVAEATPTVLRVQLNDGGLATTGPARLVYDPINFAPVLFGASDGVDVAPFDVTLPF